MRPRSMRRAAARAAVARAIGMAASTGTATAEELRVTNLDDAGNGSLRAAIEEANRARDVDEIVFKRSLKGTIRLRTGALEVDTSMSIDGPGEKAVSISGDANGNGNVDEDDSQIFRIYAGTEDNVGEVSISGLTMTGGYAEDGAAIVNENSKLTIRDSTITNNEAYYSAGAIMTFNSLSLIDSTISDNKAGYSKGAIYFGFPYGPGDLVIQGSTITGNEAQDDAVGYFSQGIDSVVIADTTISGNEATYGSSDCMFFEGSFEEATVIRNTTIADNKCLAILSYNVARPQPMRITNSTITENEVERGTAGIVRAESDYEESNDTIRITSSIISGNVGSSGAADLSQSVGDDGARGKFVVSSSLIGEVKQGTAVVEDPAGTNIFDSTPQLGILSANGGPTKTILPKPGSPAVDAGVANGLKSDQRGEERTIDIEDVRDAPGSDGTDIGAVELAEGEKPSAGPGPPVRGASLGARRKQPQSGRKVVISVEASSGVAARVDLAGKVRTPGEIFRLRAKHHDIGAKENLVLRMGPRSKADTGRILTAIESGHPVKARIKGTISAAGDVYRRGLTVRLVPRKGP